jgi:glycosyltransferase involved in cell wall biosynthesis
MGSFSASVPSIIKSAALLDRVEPEFVNYLAGESVDLFMVPRNSRPYRWNIPATARVHRATTTAVLGEFSKWLARRSIFPSKIWGGLADAELRAAEWLAKNYARQVSPEFQNLVISQSLVPYLWNAGVLKDRRFSILLNRPPLGLQNDLLLAAQRLLPMSPSLEESRVSQQFIEAEIEALASAEKVVTPHEYFAKCFANLRKLDWEIPEVVSPPDVRNPSYVLLPASLTAREGAHVALAAAEALEMPLLVCGENPEGLAIESDMVRFTSENQIPWHEVAAVIHPTVFTSWPRLHLHAMALGIPVVATESCGFEAGPLVALVPFNDEVAAARALERAISREVDSGREGTAQLFGARI